MIIWELDYQFISSHYLIATLAHCHIVKFSICGIRNKPDKQINFIFMANLLKSIT
jgi:hypothetical protein